MSTDTSTDTPGPILGPCTSWISGSDVAACPPCSEFGSGADVEELLAQVAVEASMVLYELSGGRFNGVCERTVRPCRDTYGSGGCWDAFAGGGAWWGWCASGVVLCGCRPLSTVKLAGYPIREILEVKIDGVALPEFDGDGFRNWRLDDRCDLVRMDLPGNPVTRRRWPACQNLALDDDQPGTFSVRYSWGIDPPPVALRAAAALACQLALSCPGVTGAEKCLLPEGVTKVVRQGIEIDRQLLAGLFDSGKPTGITALDLFISGYVGMDMLGKQQAAVWSPDVQQYARRVGQ